GGLLRKLDELPGSKRSRCFPRYRVPSHPPPPSTVYPLHQCCPFYTRRVEQSVRHLVDLLLTSAPRCNSATMAAQEP
ncbi:unnamed protein product, partial [Ectocarpus fasciculatus]